MSYERLKIVEGLFGGLIERETVSLTEFFTGLHNAFVHGEIMTKAGYTFSGEQLSEMFDHFDALNKLAYNIQEGDVK